MRPIFQIISDGTDVTSKVADRLLSLRVRDHAEDKSDEVQIEIDDRAEWNGAETALPEIDTEFSVSMGYAETGLLELGRYAVDGYEVSSLPAVVRVKARSAKLPTAFRSPKSDSFHDKTVKEIAEEVAAPFGFGVKVHPDIADIKIPHIDQTGESPMAFLTRLSRDLDAVARPVAGQLVITPRGKGESASGRIMPERPVTPGDVSEWTYQRNARSPGGKAETPADKRFGGVKSVWWDEQEQEMKFHQTGEGEPSELRFGAASESVATRKAEGTDGAKARKEHNLTMRLPGDASWAAEQTLVLVGFRTGVPAKWRVMAVEHAFESGGFTTSIEAERAGANDG